MNRTVFWTAIVVWVLISFVPQLAIPSLMGGMKKRGGG